MKTPLKTFVRLAVVAVVLVLALVIATAGMLMSERAVKAVLLPRVSDAAGIDIRVDGWRFTPWASLAVRGLSVGTPGGGATGVFVRAASASIAYTLSSLFSGHPVLHSIELDEPELDMTKFPAAAPAERGTKAPGPARPGEPRGRKRSGAFPLTLEKLVIRNGSVRIQDTPDASCALTAVNVAATDIAPMRNASALLTGVLAVRMSSNVVIDALPFALQAQADFAESIQPGVFTTTLLISNVAGRAEALDLDTFVAGMRLEARKAPGGVINVSRGTTSIDWDGARVAELSATGIVDMIESRIAGATLVHVARSRLWQGFVPPDAGVDIRETSADMALQANVSFVRSTAACAGNATVRRVGFTVDGTRAAQPIDAETSFAFDTDWKAKLFDLPAFALQLVQSGKPVVQARTEKPIRLAWDSQRGPGATGDHATLSVLVSNLDLKQFNGVLHASGARIGQGAFSAGMLCDVADAGRRISLTGRWALDGLDAQHGAMRWRGLGVASQFLGSIDSFSVFDVSRCTLKFTLDDLPKGEIAAAGMYDAAAGSNRLAIAVANLSGDLLAPALDPGNRNPNLKSLVFTLQSLAEKQAGRRMPQQIAAKLAVNNTAREAAGQLRSLSVDLYALCTPDDITLRKCNLAVLPGRRENALDLTGTVFIPPTNALSVVTLASPFFDATPLMDTFMPGEPAPRPTPAGKPAPAPRPPEAARQPGEKAGAEPPPVSATGRNLLLQVRLDDVVARDVEMNPAHLDILFTNNVLSAATREMVVNGGTVHLDVQANLGVTGYAYTVATSITNVPARPLINSFAPSRRDRLDATVNVTAAAKGLGVTKPNLKRNLAATADILLLNGRFNDVPILNRLATLVNYDELRSLPFKSGVVKAHARNGVATIDTCEYRGDNIRAGAAGTVDFDENLDLTVHLSLSAKAVTAILSNNLYRVPVMSSTAGAFIDLPMPIGIGGTISDPLPKVQGKEITVALIKSLGANLSETVGAVMEALDSNKKIRGTVGKGVEQGVKFLEGVLNPGAPKKQE
ncbi:hypothetical protein GX586_12910 [bacterium]|nr:hypothetical protein [bacterium]